MAQSDFDRMMALTGLGTTEQVNTMRQESLANIQAKQASVQESAKMKKILLGDKQLQRTVVTADQQGNELAQDQQIQDALNMDPFEFVIKYGPQASRDRENIRNAYNSLRQEKQVERTAGEKITDGALDAVNSVNQILATPALLGLQAYDSIGKGLDAVLPDSLYSYEPIAPKMAQGMQNASEANLRLQSETSQKSAVQTALENELDKQDRQAAYDRGDINWLQKQGQAVTDTVENLGDNPIEVTRLGVNAAASIVPIAKMSQMIGKAQALTTLGRQGIKGAAAQEYLKTTAGQMLITESAINSYPAMAAVIGSGSAANQAQVAIISMSDETLQSLPEYAELSAKGMDNDAIRNELASRAGNISALSGAALGYVTGFLNRGFDVAPLRSGGTGLSRVGNAVTNTAKETVQEAAEEGATQLSSNLGVASVDPNQSISEDVAVAATQGGLGGTMSAGLMQAPGAARGVAETTVKTTIDALSATGKTVLSGANTLSNARANARDARSDTGIQSTVSAIQEIDAAVETIASSAAEDPIRQSIVQEIVDATTLGAEQQSISELFTALDQQKITDIDATNAAGLIGLFAAIQNIGSDSLREKVNSLEDNENNTPVKEAYAKAVEQMNVVESSTVLKKAKDVISALSSEEIQTLVPVNQLTNENVSPEQKKTIADTAAVIARINPQAFTLDELNLVLNQMSPEDAANLSKTDRNNRATIQTARDNLSSAEEANKIKEENQARFERVLENLTGDAKTKQQKLRDRIRSVLDVRIDIQSRGNKKSNKDGHASLTQYVGLVNQLMSEGKVNAARDTMTQLANFAQSQINKVSTLNQATSEGANGKQYFYQAYNGARFFEQTKLPLYVNQKSPASLAFALDVHADTQEVVTTYENLRNAYPELSNLEAKSVPGLDLRIDTYLEKFPEQAQQKVEATQETIIDEPSPIVEAPAVVEETPAPAKTLKERFANLKGGVENRFVQTFSRKTNKESLLDLGDVQAELPTKIKEKLKFSETKQKLLDSVFERVTPIFKGAISKAAVPSEAVAKMLTQNKINAKNTRVANLFGSDDTLDPVVLEAAAMAAIEYIGGAYDSSYETDTPQDLFTGMSRNAPVSQSMKDAASFGGQKEQLVLSDIARNIQNMLGVKANKNAAPEDAQGIFGALAATVLKSLEDQGLIERETFEATDPEIKKTYYRYAVRVKSNLNATVESVERKRRKEAERKNIDYVELTDEELKDLKEKTKQSITQTKYLRKVMAELRMPFSEVFKGERSYYIGEPPSKVENKTKWNQFASLTGKMRKALETQQNIKHYFNIPMLAMVDSIGTDALKNLLGFVELTDAKRASMHPEAIRAQEGRNNTIQYSINSLEAYRSAFGEESLEDTPIYFENAVTSNGRMMQQSPVGTPQSDKVMRELLVPEATVVSMNNANQMAAFWSGIAQALDSASIEKENSFDVIRQSAQEELTKHEAAISLLQNLLKNDKLTKADGKKLTTQLKKVDGGMKAYHALMAEAARRNAVEAGSNEFTSALTIEADGKTDGPLNSIMNLLSPAEITPQLLSIMASGGFFIGSDPTSLDRYYQSSGKDLYGMVAEKLQDKMRALDLNSMANAMDIMEGLLTSVKGGKVERDSSGLIISRDIVKNPLTVLFYNSSEKGIAGSLADLSAKKGYALLSQFKESKAKRLTTSKVYRENKAAFRAMYLLLNPNGDPKAKNIDKFFADKKANKQIDAININENNLADLYLSTMVEPLVESINDVIPGMLDNMELLQEIAEAQTKLFQEVFTNEAKKIVGNDKRGLTQEEVELAMTRALKVAPIFYTSTQSLEISEMSSQPTGRLKDKSGKPQPITTDLSGSVNVFEVGDRPDDAGKKMVPNYVISTGDGNMIASVYANDNNGVMETSIQVYDGIEMSIASFIDGSEHINKEVYKNWMSTNIFEEVQRSVDQAASIRGLSENAQKIQSELKQRVVQLETKVQESKAFKETLNTLPSSTDHMAGAKRPYVNKGSVDVGAVNSLDFETLGRTVDKLLKATQKAVVKSRSKAMDGVAKPSSKLENAIAKIATTVETHPGVMKVSGSALASLMATDEFTSDQKKVFTQVLKDDAVFGAHTFYFGDADALTEMRDDLYPDLPKTNISLGQTFTSEPIAFIANTSGETLLHEMLHTALVQRFAALEKDPAAFSPELNKAYQNLKTLGAQFVNMNASSIPNLETAERDAITAMQAQIQATQDPIIKLSEFTSWAMSNQALIEKAKRTKVHKPLLNLLMKGLDKIKEILGIKNPGYDMFSNIVFNTAIITKTFPPYNVDTNRVFEQRYGSSPRLDEVENLFNQRLRMFVDAAAEQLIPSSITVERLSRNQTVRELKLSAQQIVEDMNAIGFRLNQRQSNTFQTIHASLKTAFKLDSGAYQEATEIYNQVIGKLDPRQFVDDWANASPTEKAQADAKVKLLTGQVRGNKASSVATFIALAQVDENFQAVLQTLTLDPKERNEEGSEVDQVIRGIAQTTVSQLSRLFAKAKTNGSNINEQLRDLTLALSEIQEERGYAAERLLTDYQRKADAYAADKVEKLSKAATKKLLTAATQFQSSSKYLSAALTAAAVPTALMNKTYAKEFGKDVQSALNRTRYFDWLQALVRDLRIDDDYTVLGIMINKVRALSDRVRQHEKDDRIKNLTAAFTKKLTKREHQDMYVGIGRTDLASLGRQNVLNLLADPSSVVQEITAAKAELRRLAPQNYNTYLDKIGSLANYMTSWKVDTPNLLRNAHAIAHLYNEGVSSQLTPNKATIATISRLISLEAFNRVDNGTKASLQNLMTTDAEAMQLLVGNLHEVHLREMSRRVQGREGDISLNNGWKGYLPMNFAQGQEVIIADDRDQAELLEMGYVRIKDYAGDPREQYAGSRGLYQTTVAGKGQFRQGILQTVHTHWHGVDVRQGNSVTSQATSGYVAGPAATRINQSNRVARAGQNVNYMLPILDESGSIMGYEYSIPVEDLEGAAPDFNLIDAVGTWFGRIEEETIAKQLNEETVKLVKETYDRDYADKSDEFINIADPNLEDAVYKDAWKVLGWETKENAAQVFGRANYFPVKRAEIDAILGYRMANPKDLWTGVSRIDPETQKIMRELISLPFGDNTFKYLTKAYGTLSHAVSWAKLNIVIRSGIVPLGNFISNSVHLATWGIGLGQQLKVMPKKLKEISRVVEIQKEIGKLNTKIPSLIGNNAEIKRIRAKITALEDEIQTMSIAPVYNNYEFSTISEGLTQTDIELRNSSFFDWAESQTDKLPPIVKDITKTAILAKDTELFRMMHHFMQYGDFVAKSMVYDQLIETRQKTPDEALAIISNEFVNYNLPVGRWREALEQSGMLWFSNYALRIMPIWANMLRERPVSALLYTGAIAPALDIDTVTSGSVVGKAWRGVLGYSFGPGMGFRSIGMNPILNTLF